MLFHRSVVVVVPALDEAPRIGRVVRTMPKFVDKILVVDDGSSDGTSEAAVATGDRRVEILRNASPRGVGAAIVRGYLRGAELTSDPCDAVAVMAGDGQMDPLDLERVVGPVVRDGVDYVKGNRFRHEDRGAMPKVRYLGGRALSLATSLATGRRIEDSQCGFTAISRRALSRLDLSRIYSGFGYPNDLFARIVEANLTTKEVIVRPVYADEVSKLRPKHAFRIARIVAAAGLRRAGHMARKLG